jgi:glycosyltransferase involved in cell wall biosynthesis
MRIGLITVRSDIGGGPKHVSDLLNFLSENNIETTVWSPNDEPYAKFFRSKANHYFKIPHRSFSFTSFFKILIHCKKNTISLVHSHGRGAGIYTKLLNLFGVKVIHTYHGIHAPKNFGASIKYYFDRVFKYSMAHAVFVSRSEQELADDLNLLPNNFSIINNGIRLDPSIKSSKRENSHIFGSLSRLDPQKGNDLLIKNFVQLKQLIPNAILNIAGNGEQRSEIENLIQENNADSYINLVGETNEPIRFLKGIDYFISNSLGEGLPYSVLEAMSEGIPCILSNVSGHNSLIPTSELFSPSSSEELIEVFQYIKENSDDHISRNTQLLSRKFDLNRNFKKLLEIYKIL